MASSDGKFRQAAWTYFIYGVVYWLGGLYLQMQGFGPGRFVGLWFIIGAVIVLLFPYLLSREVEWFNRWVLYRRDFARILTLLVFIRALEVGRIAYRGASASTMPAIGGGVVPGALGAWAFLLITLGTAFMLARAAWSKP